MDDFCFQDWESYQAHAQQQQAENDSHNETDQKPFGRLSLLGDRLKNRKPTPWVISGLVPDKSITFLHALPKVGKTFVAVDWSVSVASGQDWCGCRVGKKGGVIYVSGEGNEAIDLRFAGCCKHRGIGIDNLPIALPDRAYQLPIDGDELIQDVTAIAASFDGIGVSLVVFDTLRRTLQGDMNSNSDIGAWIRAADDIKARLNCAVLVVHHTLRGGERMGGAQTLEASHDSLVYLTDLGYCEDKASKRVLLTHQQAKDSACINPIGLILQQVAVDSAYSEDDENTLVVVPDPQGAIGAVNSLTSKKRGGYGKKQLEALTVLQALQRHGTENLKEGDYPAYQARVRFSEWQDDCIRNGIARKPSEFKERILLRLIEARLIATEGEYVLPIAD